MRAMGKRRKCPSLLIFHRIKKGQKRRSPLNCKIRSPPFLWFFYPSKIERPTAFSLRLVVHALCFDQLYCCTCKLFSNLCILVQDNLAPAWPQYDVNTCWNLIGQKEASHREASQREASRPSKAAYWGGVPPPKKVNPFLSNHKAKTVRAKLKL